MNAFRFRLERVLEWRRGQLDHEELLYKQQAAALAALDRERHAVAESGRQAEVQVRSLNPLLGRDLAGLDGYRGYVRNREAELEGLRAACERRLAERRQAMLEARRRFRLLEKLKERRRTEWQGAADKEIEELAGESYAAQWTRKSSRSL